jgi:hypothetical protein
VLKFTSQSGSRLHQQQRIYYIDNDRFIQELCYSGSQGDQWFPGALQNTLKVRAQSGSSLAAVHWYDGERNSCIRVFYQGESVVVYYLCVLILHQQREIQRVACKPLSRNSAGLPVIIGTWDLLWCMLFPAVVSQR